MSQRQFDTSLTWMCCYLTLSVHIATLYFWPTNCRAEVLHRWKLDAGDDFLADSVGNVTLAAPSAGTSPSVKPFALDADGRGDRFLAQIKGLGDNTGAAEIIRNSVGFWGEGSTPVSDAFTIELFTHIDSFAGTPLAVNLAGQVTKALDVSSHGWSFKIRMDEWGDTKVQELAFANSDGQNWFAPGSGIIIEPDTDYYLAGTFDLPEKTITYYAYDLDENSLQRTTVPHTMSTLHLDSTIRIGDAECGCTLDGLIDEVRLSDEILSFDQLLFREATFSDGDLAFPREMSLGPGAIYSQHSRFADRVIDYRSVTQQGRLKPDQSMIAKFELPEFDHSGIQIDSAILRFYVSGTAENESNISLWHSIEDNDLEFSAADFGDPSFVDTSLRLVEGDVPLGEYFEIDVTELVAANYSADSDDAVATFQLRSSGTANYRVSLPRQVGRQPELVLSFSNSRVAVDCSGDGTIDAADLACISLLGARDLALETLNTLPGDLDGNGDVSFSDFLVLSKNFALDLPNYGDGNIDLQNGVDFADFLILSTNFGLRQGGSFVATPESSDSYLLILGLASLVLRRRSFLTAGDQSVT